MFGREPERRELQSCGVCGFNALTTAWHLPKLPFTEAFGEYDPGFPSPDQDLMRCELCGHVQLRWQIDPQYLYSADTYFFGSSRSPKLEAEQEFLIDFIRCLVPNRHYASALEFGANNLSFAPKLLQLTDQLVVCDPLLPESHGDPRVICLPITVEAVIASGIMFRPELVVARHTLEHIGDPATVINALLDTVSDPGLLVFEVPSLSHMKAKLRFDAVTHQHVHYFDLTSVLGLAQRTNSHLVSFTYNERGSNGGSLIFALSRHGLTPNFGANRSTLRLTSELETSIAHFETQMQFLRDAIDWQSEKAFGFGASLMLATLDYHLDGRISELKCVFDDDENRHNTTYCNVEVSVLSTRMLSAPESGTFVITSLENARAIYSRLRELGAGRIVAPVLS